MKKSFLIILLMAFFTVQISAQQKTITIEKVPDSVEEFLELRSEIGDTPEGGAALMILSMLIYSENKDLGRACMTIALDRYNVGKGNAYKGYAPARHLNYHLSRFDGKPYWPKAYIRGTDPADQYAYSEPLKFDFSRNRYSGSEEKGRVKVFVKTYGVRPRPIGMKRNKKGIWKAKNVSSLFLDVRAPDSGGVDDL